MIRLQATVILVTKEDISEHYSRLDRRRHLRSEDTMQGLLSKYREKRNRRVYGASKGGLFWSPSIEKQEIVQPAEDSDDSCPPSCSIPETNDHKVSRVWQSSILYVNLVA